MNCSTVNDKTSNKISSQKDVNHTGFANNFSSTKTSNMFEDMNVSLTLISDLQSKKELQRKIQKQSKSISEKH